MGLNLFYVDRNMIYIVSHLKFNIPDETFVVFKFTQLKISLYRITFTNAQFYNKRYIFNFNSSTNFDKISIADLLSIASTKGGLFCLKKISSGCKG